MRTVIVDGARVAPSKVVCVGRNYVEHIKELNNEVPTSMVLFMKPNSALSSELITGEQTPLHYEGEISFLMKQQCIHCRCQYPGSPPTPQRGDFEEPIETTISQKNNYSLVIQCGGCMVTRKQLLNRLKPYIEAGIPVTNYGMTLAYVNGIFERATKMFSGPLTP